MNNKGNSAFTVIATVILFIVGVVVGYFIYDRFAPRSGKVIFGVDIGVPPAKIKPALKKNLK